MTEQIKQETLEQFCNRHGGDPMPVFANYEDIPQGYRGERTAWKILPDGAMFSDDPNNPRREPPTDEVERLRLQTQYATNLVRRLKKGYVDLQNGLQVQTQIS